MKLTNINGMSDAACSCGTWLDHWRTFSKQRIIHCPVPTCYGKDLVGVHVQKARDPAAAWYIFPLCTLHARHAGELEVSDSFDLVSANKQQTCAKPS